MVKLKYHVISLIFMQGVATHFFTSSITITLGHVYAFRILPIVYLITCTEECIQKEELQAKKQLKLHGNS